MRTCISPDYCVTSCPTCCADSFCPWNVILIKFIKLQNVTNCSLKIIWLNINFIICSDKVLFSAYNILCIHSFFFKQYLLHVNAIPSWNCSSTLDQARESLWFDFRRNVTKWLVHKKIYVNKLHKCQTVCSTFLMVYEVPCESTLAVHGIVAQLSFPERFRVSR